MAFRTSMVAPLIPNVNVITDFMAERIGRINSVFLALIVMVTQRYQVLAFQVARLMFSSIHCATTESFLTLRVEFQAARMIRFSAHAMRASTATEPNARRARRATRMR
jgi:hypothetical protein